jgi:poly(3-hydroxybutyrate) depolymerase
LKYLFAASYDFLNALWVMTPLRPLILSALVAVQAVLAVPSSGCQEKDDPVSEAVRGFSFQDRHVRVSFPPGYTATKPASLIFAYHDAGMTTEEMEKLTQFNNPELNRNAIVVYPSALNVRLLAMH